MYGTCLYVCYFLVSECATQRLKVLIQKVLPDSKWKSSIINMEQHQSCVMHSTTIKYWLHCNGNSPALRLCDERISFPESHNVVDKTYDKGSRCCPRSFLVQILRGYDSSLWSRNYRFEEKEGRNFHARAKERPILLKRLKVELWLMGLKWSSKKWEILKNKPNTDQACLVDPCTFFILIP